MLETSGLIAGKDFFLSFSPERIDPGNKKWNLELIPKIVGGINKESLDITRLLFSQIIEKVVPVSSLKIAEATKMLENIFRSVNIALVNDLSKFFEKLGIDTWETIAAASSKPFGFMPFFPGPGWKHTIIPPSPTTRQAGSWSAYGRAAGRYGVYRRPAPNAAGIAWGRSRW